MERIKKSIFFLSFVLIIFWSYKLYNNKRDDHPDKIVIFLTKEGEEKPYIAEKELLLNDCVCYFDYNDNRSSVLYLNDLNKVIEKIINTNDIEELKILDYCKDAALQDKFHYNPSLMMIQYRSNGQEITFALDDTVFSYHLTQKKLIKEIENYEGGQYKWTDSGKLYYTHYEDSNRKLYLYEENESIPILMYGDICNFVFSESEEKIYFISNYVKNFYGFGFELGYELGEYSLEDNRMKICKKYNSGNWILKCVDDEYLFYVNTERNFWGTKVNKVYCMELQSGRSRCIFETYHLVSDIVIE